MGKKQTEKAAVQTRVAIARVGSELRRQRSSLMDMPEDIESWLERAETFARELPDELPQKQAIRDDAWEAHRRDGERLRVLVSRINENIVRARHDWSVIAREKGNAKGGRQPKKSQAIYEWARTFLENNPNMTNDELWQRFFESEDLESEDGRIIVYAGNDRIWQEDHGRQMQGRVTKKSITRNTLNAYAAEIRKEIKR